MARALDATQITAADELRALLTETEKQVANLRGQGGRAVELLHNLDRITTLWPELEASGVDLRPEAGRWETLQAQVEAHAGAIVQELAAVGGLAALRGRETYGDAGLVEPRNGARAAAPDNAEQPLAGSPGEGLPWWWYLDRHLRERRRRRMVRSTGIVLAVLAVAAIGIFLFRRLFPVDPKVEAAAFRINAGQQDIANNHDYVAALAEFRTAADLTPSDADSWLWLGATQQKLGQDPAESFATARRLSKDDLSYFLARGPVYAQLESFDEARADLNAAIRIDPENPQAWYFLAGVDEAQGKLPAAAADLEKASTYADARQNGQLVAMARVRLGYLFQRMQASSANGPAATPPGN